jgi:TonB family protein
MMCKKKSSRWSAAKLLFVLPLVALSLAATATTVYVTVDNIDESKVKQNSQNNQTQSRIEERTFDTEVVKDDIFALSPAGSERYNLVPAEANVATQQSEKREIKGKVVDEQGKPISGVIVLVKKSPLGSITDSDGQFAGLKVTDEAVLAISHVGYERQEVPVKGKKFVDIVLKTKVYTTETAAVVSSEPAVLKAEIMPTFMGGDLNKFRNWVQARLKYPKYAQENVITGRVIVDVIIEKDGTLTDAGFKQLAHEVLAAEVERVVKTSPKWEPGSNKGKPVRVQFSVPFNFQIRNGGPVNNANKGNDEDQPLMKAEVLPSFKGGNLNTYRSWVESEIVYPKKLRRKKIGGRVTVEFIIDKDGSVIFSKIMQSPHELLSAEVERVIKSSPKWSPGKQRGEPVMVKMQLPVEFTAPQKSKK